MARKPLRPCRHPGCTELTRDGWCPEHRPAYKRRESSKWHSWYRLPIWIDDLRPTQLLEHPYCAECAKQGFRTLATEVDHKTPHRGVWSRFIDRSDLQSLCHWHHSQKTMREINGRRKKSDGK